MNKQYIYEISDKIKKIIRIAPGEGEARHMWPYDFHMRRWERAEQIKELSVRCLGEFIADSYK